MENKRNIHLHKKEYDLSGNVTLETTEDKTEELLTQMEYPYDEANRLIEIIGYLQNTKSPLKQFKYAPFRRLPEEIDAKALEQKLTTMIPLSMNRDKKP